MYNVVFDGLFKKYHEIRITLSLGKDGRERLDELNTEFALNTRLTGFGLNLSSGNGWHNYLTKIYKVTAEDFERLDIFIAGKIKEDFSQLTEQIGDYLLRTSVSNKILPVIS